MWLLWLVNVLRFRAEYYCVTWPLQSFTHSPTETHLGYFHICTVMDTSVANIPVQAFAWTDIFNQCRVLNVFQILKSVCICSRKQEPIGHLVSPLINRLNNWNKTWTMNNIISHSPLCGCGLAKASQWHRPPPGLMPCRGTTLGITATSCHQQVSHSSWLLCSQF